MSHFNPLPVFASDGCIVVSYYFINQYSLNSFLLLRILRTLKYDSDIFEISHCIDWLRPVNRFCGTKHFDICQLLTSIPLLVFISAYNRTIIQILFDMNYEWIVVRDSLNLKYYNLLNIKFLMFFRDFSHISENLWQNNRSYLIFKITKVYTKIASNEK